MIHKSKPLIQDGNFVKYYPIVEIISSDLNFYISFKHVTALRRHWRGTVAHRPRYTATPVFIWSVSGYRTVPTSIRSTTRYEATYSSKSISCECIILMLLTFTDVTRNHGQLENVAIAKMYQIWARSINVRLSYWWLTTDFSSVFRECFNLSIGDLTGKRGNCECIATRGSPTPCSPYPL